MPKVFHSSGKSTHQMADNRRISLLKTGLIVIALMIGLIFLLANPQTITAIFGPAGLLAALFLFKALPAWFDGFSSRKAKTIRRAERGAKAEEAVGSLLEKLDHSFIVIHDVETPYGNIDHVVISQRGGVFLLETKSHHGRVTTTDSEILINGKMPEKNFVAQVLQNSYWLREKIGSLIHIQPWITPVVVFTNAFVPFAQPVKNVRTVNSKYLLSLLQEQGGDIEHNRTIWTYHEQIARLLCGIDEVPVSTPAFQAPPASFQRSTNSPSLPPRIPNQTALKTLPSTPSVSIPEDRFCPKCGKSLAIKTTRNGLKPGRRYKVCPDYPQCRTAIPMDD
ncbi:MAG TPA: NERD domain-containing protein [Anaerolineaceae bacterium]|nr:NERD domain-containing protein [Anaerolineaceae bacterium]HPN52309.1 NERD domain-containing protein [Anaerolineaceae bacterium]